MTALHEKLFADAFSDLVARAASEPFVGLCEIGRHADTLDRYRISIAEVSAAGGRGRRFADLESWIVAKESALRRDRRDVPL